MEGCSDALKIIFFFDGDVLKNSVDIYRIKSLNCIEVQRDGEL